MAKVMNLGAHCSECIHYQVLYGFAEENNGKKTLKYCKHYKSIKYD